MHFKIFDTDNVISNDLIPVECGSQDCESGHAYGPHKRSYHLIHFVTRGCGIFEIGKKRYNIFSGELFYIPPDIQTFYKADTDDPWSYSWIGLRGIAAASYLKSAGLSSKRPVMPFSDNALSSLNGLAYDFGSGNSLRATGLLYLTLDELIKCGCTRDKYKSSSQLYAESAVRYINENLYRKITVAETAEHIGIDCSYLCAVFKKFLNCSPQQYISEHKITAAKKLLTETPYEIKHIASSLGYDDQFTFSHFFKNGTGMSPKQWRIQNQ